MLVALSLDMALIPYIGRPVGGLLWGATACCLALLSTPGQSRGHQELIGFPESLLLNSQGSQRAPGASLIRNLGTRPIAVAKPP